MTKKHDQATALASILNAKRGLDPVESAAVAVAPLADTPIEAPPSPAPLPPVSAPVQTRPEPAASKRPLGKSSDPEYSQYSVYLRKTVRKKVGRALDDDDAGQDFSDLVEDLLEKWLKSRT